MRDTCTKSPALSSGRPCSRPRFGAPTWTAAWCATCRVHADRAVRVAAGWRSAREPRIGTSSAIVFTLKPLKALNAERVHVVVGVLGDGLIGSGGRPGDRVAFSTRRLMRVEDGAEVDREGLGALAGEDADAGRGVGEDALRGERLVVRRRARADVRRHRRQQLAAEERRARAVAAALVARRGSRAARSPCSAACGERCRRPGPRAR